jgi:error-prone DNA polymerase
MSLSPAYAELHCLSNFTFLRGVSSAIELAERAKKLGYEALAITDECSLAGIVRAHEAAKRAGIALIVGCEVCLEEELSLVLLAENAEGYTALCRIITRVEGRRKMALGCAGYAFARLLLILSWPKWILVGGSNRVS